MKSKITEILGENMRRQHTNHFDDDFFIWHRNTENKNKNRQMGLHQT